MKVKKIVCHSSDGEMLSLYVEHDCTKNIVQRMKKQISDNGDVAFLNRFSDGSYSFGIIQGDYESMGHSKGYIWSSRASVMNQIFGTNIIEVAVKLPEDEFYFSRAFDLEKVRSILPEGWDYVEGSYSDGEKYHRLSYVGNSPIEYECGKRLYTSSEEVGNNNMCLNLNTILQDRTL